MLDDGPSRDDIAAGVEAGFPKEPNKLLLQVGLIALAYFYPPLMMWFVMVAAVLILLASVLQRLWGTLRGACFAIFSDTSFETEPQAAAPLVVTAQRESVETTL